MNNGDRVIVQFPSYSKMATFVCQNGDDMVVAVDEGGKRIHHRVLCRDVARFQSCDPADAESFYKQYFDELAKEVSEATSDLLPGVIIRLLPSEYSLSCDTWGVCIFPDVMQVKSIGRVIEKPSWCVTYETVVGEHRDVVTVGNYPSTSLAAEAFISCISERRIQSHFESRCFF